MKDVYKKNETPKQCAFRNLFTVNDVKLNRREISNVQIREEEINLTLSVRVR